MREITHEVGEVVSGAGIASGLCQVFSRHTSAGVILAENADPTVGEDLERWMTQLVPDGWGRFRHRAEGPDDMPAHARVLLAGAETLVPVTRGRLALGRWQGLFAWEHRREGRRREFIVTVFGTRA